MYLHSCDPRIPLKTGDVVETADGRRIVVDKHIASGGFSLMYLAHVQGSSRFLALKELYPRQAENVRIHRRADGKIAICDALSDPETADDAALWQQMQSGFHREAELTRRAGTAYDWDGSAVQQNNPDVFQVEGPFSDRRGNTYLAIDTYQGESLRDYIERGFVKDEDGVVVANQFLEEILDILSETAVRLSALHGKGLWHLDLSPDNIYVVPSAGRTRLQPFIIDYGSAYDRNDLQDVNCHRYTCNSFSSPEVQALAQLQDPACGYAADASSDTYALVSVLFYAVTGQLFTAEQRMVNTRWKAQIRREYSAGLAAHRGADSFADGLIRFLEQGLAAGQADRYTSAKTLHRALQQLKTQYREYGNLLPGLDADELVSYMVLEKYPLYQYKGADGNIHVLCLGSGVFVKRMILSLLSCGQMADSRLHIHVVSDEREENLTSYLRAAAPALEQYSNLVQRVAEEYVTFSYDQVSDVLDHETCREILARYPDAHYFLVSLGSNAANVRAAGLYAGVLAEGSANGGRRTVINYYCSEDAANNIYAVADKADFPAWLEVDAFGDSLSSYSKTVRTLGLRTLKLAHLYNKLGNPNISLPETARQLSADAYGQRSSCASALHLKYKLASVGINPAPSTNKRAIIAAYQKALGTSMGKLLELEHRRWMMYMIADGYRAPDEDELEQFGYEMVDGKFNAAWKCLAKGFHPCLVPCSTAGISLKPEDWQTYASEKKIAASAFDPLDKVSLMLHYMAGKKCRRILEDDTIQGYFRRIANRLAYAREEAEEEGEDFTAQPFDTARQLLDQTRDTLCLAAEKLVYTGDEGLLHRLQHTFSNLGINISGEIEGLRQVLSVFAEYASCKDYKAPDYTIIRNLLWLMYADNDITCIKLRGRTIADNLTGPLILEPHRLVFFGQETMPEWYDFLRAHGNRGEILFFPHGEKSVAETVEALRRQVALYRGKCVIDITGADEKAVIAAQRLADGDSRVSLIRSTPEGCIENIHGFVTAPAYTLNTTIDANEIFSVYGARQLPAAAGYMEQLEHMVPKLWEFYREFQEDWTMVTAFFYSRGSGNSELWVRNIRLEPDTQWQCYSRKLEYARWNMLELGAVFRKLEDAGIIREFSAEEYIPGRLQISFQYPQIDENPGSDFFRRALDSFFANNIQSVFRPMQCDIRYSPTGGYTVDIHSGCQVVIYDKTGVDFADKRVFPGSRYPYSAVVPALRRLEEMGLIAELYVSANPELAPVSIRFVYTDLAVKDCLCIAGNILELYIWQEARKTRFFDDVQSNFTFTWKEGIRNELDVIMTRGLTSLIVSAKTARFNKEHLYEIKYLTERFSLNSIPVIVYSSDRAVEDGHLTSDLSAVKNRAKAMGIYLIDLNEMEAAGGSLGETLVQIACGTAEL